MFCRTIKSNIQYLKVFYIILMHRQHITLLHPMHLVVIRVVEFYRLLRLNGKSISHDWPCYCLCERFTL